METQPTQQGLMQLFMGLGLSTANPLTTLGEGNKPSTTGFDSLLAGYLPDLELVDSELLSGIDLSLTNDLLPEGGKMGGLDAEESLPLDLLNIGEPLPLFERGGLLGSAFSNDMAELSFDESIRLKSESDEKAQALLENQGFYVQSLVSSALQASNDAKSLVPQARVAEDQSSAAYALASLQAKSAVTNKELTVLSGTLSAAELSDLADDSIDNLEMDRFLGAQKKVLDPTAVLSNSISPIQTALPLATSISTQLVGAAESNVSLALAMNEDPVQQSLQDLTAVEEGEKTEVDTKLQSVERKQDDQTLRLTKGQQAWGDALSERISMNAAKDIKNVTIHLDPPELGTLELKMQIKDDQQTQVQVQVQSPQVKEALESSANRLREMLANEGLELASFDVQTGSEQSTGEQQGSNEELSDEQQNSDTSFIEGDEVLDIVVPKNNNLLDTFV